LAVSKTIVQIDESPLAVSKTLVQIDESPLAVSKTIVQIDESPLAVSKMIVCPYALLRPLRHGAHRKWRGAFREAGSGNSICLLITLR